MTVLVPPQLIMEVATMELEGLGGVVALLR